MIECTYCGMNVKDDVISMTMHGIVYHHDVMLMHFIKALGNKNETYSEKTITESAQRRKNLR